MTCKVPKITFLKKNFFLKDNAELEELFPFL